MIKPDGTAMTNAEALESRLASSRGMTSDEIEAQFKRNREMRLSGETSRQVPPPSLTSPRGLSTAEVGVEVLRSRRVARFGEATPEEPSPARPAPLGMGHKLTNAEARAQVLRTPGATLDEDSPVYPEAWKGQGRFDRFSAPAALEAETETAAGGEPTEIPPPTPALSQTLQQMIAQAKASGGNLGLQSGVCPKIMPACWAGQGNTALSPETAKFR